MQEGYPVGEVWERLVDATAAAFGVFGDFELSSRGALCDFGGFLGLKSL